MTYAKQAGKTKIIDKEKLAKGGTDSSIPDALALTVTTDKNPEHFMIQEDCVLRYPDIEI